MLWCVFMLYRNNQVYRFRISLLDTMWQYSSEEDYATYKWRHEVFASVSYKQMCNQFWKPLTPEAFYSNTSFLYPLPPKEN